MATTMSVQILRSVAFFVAVALAGCSSDDSAKDPNRVFAAIEGTSLGDTAKIAAAGDNVPCFGSEEQIRAYEDALGRKDDPAANDVLKHATPLKAGEEIKFVDNDTGLVKIERVSKGSDCWQDMNATIFTNLHHVDR